MKCVGGGGGQPCRSRDNESPQRHGLTRDHHATKREKHQQTDEKKRRRRGRSGSSGGAAHGGFVSSFKRLGHRRAPSLQGILGTFRDTE